LVQIKSSCCNNVYQLCYPILYCVTVLETSNHQGRRCRASSWKPM
jgi:hypothetical protein